MGREVEGKRCLQKSEIRMHIHENIGCMVYETTTCPEVEKRAYSSDRAGKKSWHWTYKDKYLLEIVA